MIVAANYYKIQSEYIHYKNSGKVIFQIIEELQNAIESAIIQERRNLVLGAIPLIGKYRQKLDLVPFANRQVPELLNLFQQVLYSTSGLVFDYDSEIAPDLNIETLTTLDIYIDRWQRYQAYESHAYCSNITTLNELRTISHKLVIAYQKWCDNTIFKYEALGRIENLGKLYLKISRVLLCACHYERYLLGKANER